jgi:hypothetical protein
MGGVGGVARPRVRQSAVEPDQLLAVVFSTARCPDGPPGPARFVYSTARGPVLGLVCERVVARVALAPPKKETKKRCVCLCVGVGGAGYSGSGCSRGVLGLCLRGFAWAISSQLPFLGTSASPPQA